MNLKLFIRENTAALVKNPPEYFTGKLNGIAELFLFEPKSVPDDEKVFMGTVKLVRVHLAEDQDRIDAERWRSLMACDRIRVLGTGQLGKPHQHIGLELWENYSSDVDNTESRATLTIFVDSIRTRT